MALRYRGLALKIVAVVLWGAAVMCGLAYAWRYELTPGNGASPRSRWPAGSACTLATDRPTLVMFVHPQCPCSRASLQELALLMTHCRDRIDAQVLFLQDPLKKVDWTRSDLWASAVNIPGVAARIDAGAAEQRCFGAGVSGEVFAYLPSGELLFHGGITAGRGHAGDNAGRAALESFLSGGEMAVRATPVYGCSLGPSCQAGAEGEHEP